MEVDEAIEVVAAVVMGVEVAVVVRVAMSTATSAARGDISPGTVRDVVEVVAAAVAVDAADIETVLGIEVDDAIDLVTDLEIDPETDRETEIATDPRIRAIETETNDKSRDS